jgi:hypothetical protein
MLDHLIVDASRQPSPPEYRWKDWPEDCPECGGPLEVFTQYTADGWASDGDTVHCVDPECGTIGHISVDREEGACAMFPDLE